MTCHDPLARLGVSVGDQGGELRVWSDSASAVDLLVYDEKDPAWITRTVPLARDEDAVWSVCSELLVPGRRYALRVDGPSGPRHRFDPRRALLEPYSRGLHRVAENEWRSVVVDDAFDWGASSRPGTPLASTVIYEAHIKGLTKLNSALPVELRGTYAGLAHESTVAALLDLGVTAVELLPVHAFVSEQRLLRQGLTNYWGYNTLNFFSPHAAYASPSAQRGGPSAVLREFKGMVKLLHEAGLEVILDVVYNHTAEEGPDGPTSSLRGIDDAGWYRQTAQGHYVDVTGCGNTIDFGRPAAQRLVLDSLRYWSGELGIDGFRLDLAATLGRDEIAHFQSDHPLLRAAVEDPALAGVKMIAEPWDVGTGGWQTGNFPVGWSEWNDRYRDRARNFWLSDIDYARRAGTAPVGVGGFATRLAGSSNTFSAERGPLASVNFVTAHDGFTLADLVSYNVKHNIGNGESNRDGAETNRSFNHGFEGPTTDERITLDRRKAMRNLLGTLLLSAGVPMLTAGDETGRSQRGNNNAYCQDSDLTWLRWADLASWQLALRAHTRTLLRLRREHPALRPSRYSRGEEATPGASSMRWFDAHGRGMSGEDWTSAAHRTLQYLAASTSVDGDLDRVLLVIHGVEQETTVALAQDKGVTGYTRLWNSAEPEPLEHGETFAAGQVIRVTATSMQLFVAHGSAPEQESAVEQET
ncbi:glycogen debranching protein GlgX [Rathayibacter iranicus]|uniref:Glycogen debranching enzyme GlgX n=2 Tax=Rathayibacter iranicus TaxID=59737 RepID=A0AAD1ADI4_9MICO|nr:glycogen debranching protein GlgX [Rathayibacter iranicus]AZZ55330.1 glycogen debranching enzyme GlgX [Rathayibacter iranicus]MWV30945.1 glycogen debranching protein GlgX [Rathayibacter iranicus NCPPB 2253 = VKM Ac-1602]PPI48118.1 glycogen debranching enzyme GlgX [Rathayibacter iranicus]PPI61334.1 glycogen debranching enzyme GlgX [Rathayibacter iranicus]PPI72721.1 glycogen debranching enzyme GlgX [Rathayibacter iranicus]